jgi:ribonuclease E
VGRNGFLHISDIEPHYFRQGGYNPERDIEMFGSGRSSRTADIDTGEADDDFGEPESPTRERPRRGRGPRPGARPRIKPPIQDILRRGDEVLVQVIKEGIGTKGPTLSTYISIPGRYLVLMPALGRVGVSRKIEDEETRRKLRDIMLELNPPKGLGFIVRTAGVDRTKKELSRDLAYLLRLWKVIVRRIKKNTAPIDIYEESDMIIRTIRDIFTGDVDSIYIDEPTAYERAKEFLQIVMPRYVSRLQLYQGKEPLFHKHRLDEEISRIHQHKVPLKQGGSIVIDQTEALVAIDVNSGNFRAEDNAEETAYQMNLLAAKEIARQLRLRDLGGVIVNDFIDMRKEKHRRGVERALRDAVRRDRARTKILRTSPFGLIEMTRQRIRPSLKRSVFKDCACCGGTGVVKTAESMAIEVVRHLILASHVEGAAKVMITVADDVATYLNNKKRRELAKIEDDANIVVQVYGKEGVPPEHLMIECQDSSGRELKFMPG